MKKESKILLNKAIDSLILAIEHFNRPFNQGRVESVLILLDHSFELLLKSALLFNGQKIREKRKSETYGFDKCVRTCISNKIITEEQAITLQTINCLRDAAQHYFVELSEQHFYFQAQSGLTVFKDILKSNFGKEIAESLPKRVLPISTILPSDINTFFENEIQEVKKLLSPKKRKKVEAASILRGLAIVDSSIRGEKLQPSPSYINRIMQSITNQATLANVFPGIASINISTEGTGPSINLRITKKEGIPVNVVQEGTPGATVVAIKRVNELDYYNLSLTPLAEKVGLTPPRTNAVIKELKLKEDSKYFKQILIGKSKFSRYSQETINIIKEKLPKLNLKEVWEKNKPKSKNAKINN